MNYKHLHISTRRGNYLLITLPTILINLIPNSGVKIRDYCYLIVINITLLWNLLSTIIVKDFFIYYGLYNHYSSVT